MRIVSEDTLAILTIIGEAATEPYNGKVGVAEAIRNRTSEHYSSKGSVADTVLRPVQFDCWDTYAPNRIGMALADDTDANVQECVAAWEQAKAGSNLANGAVLYYAPLVVHKPPSWVPFCIQVAALGTQLFFVPKPKAG